MKLLCNLMTSCFLNIFRFRRSLKLTNKSKQSVAHSYLSIGGSSSSKFDVLQSKASHTDDSKSIRKTLKSSTLSTNKSLY